MTFNELFLNLHISPWESCLGLIEIFLLLLSSSHLWCKGFLQSFILWLLHETNLVARGNSILILAVIMCLDLLNQHIYELQKIDLIPLLIIRWVHIHIYLEACLLYNQLHKFPLLLTVVLVDFLKLNFSLLLLLLSDRVQFLHLIYHQFNLRSILIYLSQLISELNVAIKKDLEEGGDTCSRTFQCLHLSKYHRVDWARLQLNQLLTLLSDLVCNKLLLVL